MKQHCILARYEDRLSPSVINRQTDLSCRLNADLEGGVSFTYLPTHNCADDDSPSNTLPVPSASLP